MRILRSLVIRCFAVFMILAMSGCESYFLRELPRDLFTKSKVSGPKYEIGSITTATDAVPISFHVNLKRYLYSELSKQKILGSKEDKPRQLCVLIGYYHVIGSSDSDRVESMVDFRNADSEVALGESKVSTSIRKARNTEDVAKLHAKEIVRFLTEEMKKK